MKVCQTVAVLRLSFFFADSIFPSEVMGCVYLLELGCFQSCNKNLLSAALDLILLLLFLIVVLLDLFLLQNSHQNSAYLVINAPLMLKNLLSSFSRVFFLQTFSYEAAQRERMRVGISKNKQGHRRETKHLTTED